MLLVLCYIFAMASAAHLRVVRLQGSGEGNQPSAIELSPAASLMQTPGARAEAATWCDKSGNVWLFGGIGFDDDTTSVHPKLLNDLWLFNTSRLEWSLIHSGSKQSAMSTYNEGIEPVQSVSTNVAAPESRKRAASCGVLGIVFVIFGGTGSNGSSLSDTWIFTISKGQWMPLTQTMTKSIHPPTAWSTKRSWCDLDALFVVGSSESNAIEMWKFSLQALEWTDESQLLNQLQHHAAGMLSLPQQSNSNFVTAVWNGTFYMYHWRMINDSNINSLVLSIELQRWLSIPYTYYVNNAWSMPFLWSHLNSLNSGNITCSSPSIFPHVPICIHDSRQSCNLHSCYKILSTVWPKDRSETSSWFYKDNLYIFGGKSVTNDKSAIFYNDIWILRLSYESDSNTAELVISLISALLAFVLLGVGLFCLLHYCDYRNGHLKPRELKIHYTRLRDENVYD